MISRRQFCAVAAAAALARPLSAFAKPIQGPSSIEALLERARHAFAIHGSRIARDDVIGLVDFGAPSHQPRFHIIELATGRAERVLVAHGRGSDPAHSGWLRSFSNQPGSKASSAGAYLTGALYEGQHGRSRRLIGLDESNSNAEARALVIHAADYVSPAMVTRFGKIGRSEGCLAVAAADRETVLDRLGPGRLIYVDKA